MRTDALPLIIVYLCSIGISLYSVSKGKQRLEGKQGETLLDNQQAQEAIDAIKDITSGELSVNNSNSQKVADKSKARFREEIATLLTIVFSYGYAFADEYFKNKWANIGFLLGTAFSMVVELGYDIKVDNGWSLLDIFKGYSIGALVYLIWKNFNDNKPLLP